MPNYQPKLGGKHSLPHNVYMQIRYKLRDYERQKKLLRHPPKDKNTAYLARLKTELGAIEKAAAELKDAYAAYVQDGFDPLWAYHSYDYFNYIFIRYGPDDEAPSRRTWNYYKNLLSRKIAKKLYML